jgi:hypothetical protein
MNACRLYTRPFGVGEKICDARRKDSFTGMGKLNVVTMRHLDNKNLFEPFIIGNMQNVNPSY